MPRGRGGGAFRATNAKAQSEALRALMPTLTHMQ